MGILGQYKVVRALRMLALDKRTPPALRMKAIEYLMQYEKDKAAGKETETKGKNKKLEELLELVER